MGRALSALALAVAVTAAGCSSHSSTASFRDRANAICARAAKRYALLDKATPVSAEADAKASARATALLRDTLRQLRALTPPKDVAATYSAFVATLGQSLRQTDRVAAWERRYRPSMIRALEKAQPPKHFTKEELDHPTAAILAAALKVPAYRHYLQGLERIARESLPISRRYVRLGRRLRLDRCVT